MAHTIAPTPTIGKRFDHAYDAAMELSSTPLNVSGNSSACGYFGRCGGCAFQHLSAPEYEGYKRGVAEAAIRDAGYNNALDALILVPPASRRRVTWKIDGADIGYFAVKTNDLVAVETCPALEPQLEALLPIFNALLPASFPLHEIAVTLADSGIDVELISKTKPHPNADRMKKWIVALKTHSLRRLSSRVGEELLLHYQEGDVTMRFGHYDVPLPPSAFLQPSREGQRHLTELVLSGLKTPNNKKPKKIADLFSGCGTYSVPLTAQGEVHAYEGAKIMVEALQQAVKKQAVPRLKAETRDLFLYPLSPQELKFYDTVIINPPRPGASKQAKQIAATPTLKRVIMVSCNPETFGRDARYLREGGFKLERITAVDQFVWTKHLELVGVFVR